jgi:hypothetical protein
MGGKLNNAETMRMRISGFGDVVYDIVSLKMGIIPNGWSDIKDLASQKKKFKSC